MRDRERVIGISLGGAKNQKTVCAVIESYPREGKTFLLDVHDELEPGDESLSEWLTEHHANTAVTIGTTAALELPCCAGDCTCKPSKPCANLRWGRKFLKQVGAHVDFTCYTQRPVELWVRWKILSELPESQRFDIDETLGGTRAPISVRMNYVSRLYPKARWLEVWPKLSIVQLSKLLHLPRREIVSYRKLEEGVASRAQILTALCEHEGIFVYDRDFKKLTLSLAAFDAFFAAYTALLFNQDRCEPRPRGLPASANWIAVPKR